VLPQQHRPAAPPRPFIGRLAVVLALLALAAGALAGPAAASSPNCTAEQGQALIDEGRYEQAVHKFTCVIDAQPAEPEGYGGRIEAEVLLGRYSDAVSDFQRINAFVVPVHPDAAQTILDGYAARLASNPDDVRALTGASFTHWWNYDYASAIHVLNRLHELRPDDLYSNLFQGSSRLLRGVTRARGVADLERALELAPESPDVRFIVADAYTYGLPDHERAFAEATLALDWGLDTPRVHAILATAYTAFGDVEAAAAHIQTSIDLVTTELVTTTALATGETRSLDLAPGRTYAIPIAAVAGETISIATTSDDMWDSIAVLLAPDGSPVVGSDDDNAYFAAFDWVAEETGTYMLHVTSFEAVSTGELVVTRG
jgi:tetratricopeptide (TPR) repeat protein